MSDMNDEYRRSYLENSILSFDYKLFEMVFISQNRTKILEIRVDLFPDSFRFEIINQNERLNNKSGNLFKCNNGIQIRRFSGSNFYFDKNVFDLDDRINSSSFKYINSMNERNELILKIYDALEDFAKNYQGFKENIKLEIKKLTHEEIITQAINKIDLKTHLDKFLEESTELNHDILQKKDFATELVDVEIVLECLKRYIPEDKYEDLKDKAYNKFYNQLEKLDNRITTSVVQCSKGVE